MNTKQLFVALFAGFMAVTAYATPQNYELTSPDGNIAMKIAVSENITWSLSNRGEELITDSPVSMSLSSGEVFGQNDKVRKAVRRSVNEDIQTIIYKKAVVKDNYNELQLNFKDFGLIFRAYDDGVAYRFVSGMDGDYEVSAEQAEFHFAKDWNIYVPYVAQHTESLESQYFNSFENTYSYHKLSEWDSSRMAFLPLVVEADNGVKLSITESDLLDYPGMYLYNGDATSALTARFAPVPKDVLQGGHNMLQGVVQAREDYIARASGKRAFPWRAVVVANEDKDLSNSDMVWKLASPCSDNGDYSWVHPGKVAWDWWNDWNLYGVDFKAGINNETYKYYIDFASQYGIEYVILDEGWAVNKQADLFQVIPEIDLPMLAKYAGERGVGLILWAGYWAFNRDMEKVCSHYSEMGIKGFKIDFMDRDDQQMVNFYHDAAAMAAKYHMVVDFHGAYKPTGLQRMYPNVLNFEGVHGLEQMKWDAVADHQVTYDVTIPFVRMLAGPMDYTQGAMRNATRSNYRPVNSEAMSQGTRCHQLAEYVIFESPLNMLCDSPSNYMSELECTEFIAGCPVVWDETVAVDGKIAKYVVIARRSGDKWYVGALNGWEPRDLSLNLDFLGEGNWRMEVFKDGINADRAACDYKREIQSLDASGKTGIHLAPGGGWVAIVSPDEGLD